MVALEHRKGFWISPKGEVEIVFPEEIHSELVGAITKHRYSDPQDAIVGGWISVREWQKEITIEIRDYDTLIQRLDEIRDLVWRSFKKDKPVVIELIEDPKVGPLYLHSATNLDEDSVRFSYSIARLFKNRRRRPNVLRGTVPVHRHLRRRK